MMPASMSLRHHWKEMDGAPLAVQVKTPIVPRFAANVRCKTVGKIGASEIGKGEGDEGLV